MNYFFIGVITFALGFFSGVYYQKMQQQPINGGLVKPLVHKF